MKYLLIMNPGSRSGRNKKLWGIWNNLLKKKGVSFEIAYTDSMDHATHLVQNSNDFDIVVAVGGDGTINRVIHGVLESKFPDRRVGILYSGTSPDFCKFHKIPIEPAKAIEALLYGNTKNVDVAKITYLNYKHQIEQAYFTCSCNIGMGAEIAHTANMLRYYLGDYCGTAVASVKAIAKSKKITIQINYDDQRMEITSVNNFSVIINPFLASGMKLNLAKESNDGRLALFAIKKRNAISLIKDLPKFYTGSITSAENIFTAYCQTIKINSNEIHEIEFDGDPRGLLPVTIQILPEKLKLIGGNYA